jgi:hypothetical protein
MPKIKFVFVLLLFTASNAYATDAVFQGYLPSCWGFVSGGGALFHQFEDREEDRKIEDRFIIPFETKIVAAKLGPVALSVNGMLSLYFENEKFSSLNLSMGLAISAAKEKTSPLQGLYFTLYPMYELPVIALGKTPLTTWKAATDLGIGFNLFSTTPIYISVYARLIHFWLGTQWGVAPPDFGITIGWHFQQEQRSSSRPVKRMSPLNR